MDFVFKMTPHFPPRQAGSFAKIAHRAIFNARPSPRWKNNGVLLLRKVIYRYMHIGMSGMMKLLWVRWIEFIVFRVNFIISRLFPGLGIGTFITICWWVARVSPSLISPPFLIKPNTLSVRKEYLIVGAKIMKISENTNIRINLSFKLPCVKSGKTFNH